MKGRVYGRIDVPNSSWQLEPRASHLSARERTISTTSTTSTQSSFALVSETDISSVLAASLDGGFFSEFDDTLSSPALSSPVLLAADDPTGLYHNARRRTHFTTSHPVSPHPASVSLSGPSSVLSSVSSLESLHGDTGRLLTIHIEKTEPIIWPSLIVGPVPEPLAPIGSFIYPWEPSPEEESQYNMDPTSMVLIGLDLFDIRNEAEQAFEYFV